MFDVGQHVICIRKAPWTDYAGRQSPGPAYLAECVIADVIREGSIIKSIEGVIGTVGEDGVELMEWRRSLFAVKWFRPKEPDIEALRELMTDVPDEKAAELITEMFNDSVADLLASGATVGDGSQSFFRLSRARAQGWARMKCPWAANKPT